MAKQIAYARDGALVRKTYPNGEVQEFDLTLLPDSIREEATFYGIKQKLSDCHSQDKTDPERIAKTDAMWNSLVEGRWNLRGDGRFILDAIDWEKLARAVAETRPDEESDAAYRAVLGRQPTGDESDADKRKLVKWVKDLLAFPEIAQAYGWEQPAKSIDDLLDI